MRRGHCLVRGKRLITEPMQRALHGRAKKTIAYADILPFLSCVLSEGSSVCLGGLFKQGRPVALVRELIRSNIGNLKLFSSPGSGYDVDLLIAAGLIAETFLPAVTLENRFCSNFRTAVETGRIKSHAVDALTIMGGLMAAANGVPFQPVTAWAGSDIIPLNPLIKMFKSPFDDQQIYAARAIHPDLVLLHAQEGDEYGNIRNLATMTYADALMARAARNVIVSVDRLIPNETILNHPKETTVAGIYVDAIVEIPFGAHPSASFPFYSMDEEFIASFADLSDEARRSGSTAELVGYIDRYIKSPQDGFDYIDSIGGYRRLARLEREARFI